MNNITLVEGRTLMAGERVEVYYNLNKGGYSIKSLDKNNKDKGKVVAYSQQVTITDATFHASEATLKKILEKKQKAVYAVVRGTLVDAEEKETSTYNNGYINPYTTGHFINRQTGERLDEAKEVHFTDKLFYYVEG